MNFKVSVTEYWFFSVDAQVETACASEPGPDFLRRSHCRWGKL